MKYMFRKVKLSKANKERLDKINEIIEDYKDQGYVLTLRQLYYQLVSSDVIPNVASEYSKLSNLLKEGRMGGIVDWAAIEDRLRQPYTPNGWSSAKQILEASEEQFEMKRLKGQKNYIEVWVEKDALSGVLKRVTRQYHVPILVNRGYSSASAMFDSFERFKEAFEEGQSVTILYLGDYDPSGIDMIRDIKKRSLEFMFGDGDMLREAYNSIGADSEYDDMSEEQQQLLDRLLEEHETTEECQTESLKNKGEMFFDIRKAVIYDRFNVVPIALTREQIDLYNPPPNPAKKTDPRSKDFIDKHGSQSWEVDALRPDVLNTLLENEIMNRLDMGKFADILEKEKHQKDKLKKIIKNWKD